MTRLAAARQGHPEEGSVTPWFIVSALALIVIVGLVLDGGSHLHAQQHAYGLAAQAARTGGQQLDTTAVMAGEGFTVDQAQAVTAANQYLATAGTDGTVWVEGGRVHVTVRQTYTPQILGMFGAGPFPVEVTATARLVRVVAGAEQ